MLQYPGGATSTTKGAMLTHRQRALSTSSGCPLGARPRLYGEEKMLGVLPFFHVFSMTVAD